LLIEIAKRNPTRERDLQVIRGLPRRDLSAIVQAVAEARALPLDQCPPLADREQDPPQHQLVTNVMMAVLGDLCARWRLASNLVANNAEIKLLVRSRQQGTELPPDLLLTKGWRGAHVLPELLAVLDGRRSLYVANVKAENPFAFRDVEGA
jgi:ribonuclease D